MLLGRSPVKMLCEGCGRTLETWRLDIERGQLRLPSNGVGRSPAGVPDRAGMPQVIGYRCKAKDCRRRVVLGSLSIESAVIRAMREGRTSVRVGEHLIGQAADKLVHTTTVSAKAPIPGGYRRRPEWPS